MKILRYLGWHKPLPELAAQTLLKFGVRSEADGTLDLSSILVLIPGRHAIRILNEKIAALLERSQSGGFFPPEFYTPERFVLEGSDSFAVAADMELVHVWQQVLKQADPKDFPSLFPADIDKNDDTSADYLAGEFIRLVRELSSGGHTVASARAAQISENPERWEDIQTLEERVHALLAENGLVDSETLKLQLANSAGEFRRFRQIIVIGMPDLSELLIKRLEKVSELLDVEIWINAPDELHSSFDPWGRPVPERWSSYPVSFSPETHGLDCIFKTETIEQEAAAAAALLLEPDRNLSGKALAIGSETLFQPMQNELSRLKTEDGAALEIFNPSGEQIRSLRLFELLTLLNRFLSDDLYETADAFLHHPDVLRWLAATLKKSQNRILQTVDNFRIAHIPDNFKGLSAFGDEEASAVFNLLEDLRQLLSAKPLDAMIHDFLQLLYGNSLMLTAHGFPLKNEVAALERILTLIARSPVFRSAAKQEVFDELLNAFGSERLYSQRTPCDFPVVGFLELPWVDAKEIVVCGMNDGMIPESAGGTSFLSDSQRARLGIADNARRAARDLLYLESILNAREPGAVRFLAARTDAAGKPQKFSRFFFQGGREGVLRRAALLYEPMRMIEPPSDANTNTHFILQPDYSLAAKNAIPTVSVTAFQAYLASPFRFFLQTVMHMSDEDFEPKELAKNTFGTCIHAALERAAKEPVADPLRLQERLFEELDIYMRQQYGSPLPVLIAIQNEQMKQRLAHCAEVLAQSVKEGFVPIETEYSLGGKGGSIEFCGMNIKGRIDRIEYSAAQNHLRLIDYKTGDRGDSPESTHLAGAKGHKKLTNLQLPLYRMLILRDPVFRERHPEIDLSTVRISCGYLNMPASVIETKIAGWDNLDEYLPLAEETLERISAEMRGFAQGIFREDPDASVPYDNFASFFLPDLRTAVPSATWNPNKENA